MRPTASLGSRDKRFSLPSSNWLLVPILPWEHPKVRTLGCWHQSPRPGVTPPGWGYARERRGRSSLGHHLYLAWDIEPKVRTLRSIQHLHVDGERSEVNGGLWYLTCLGPLLTHTCPPGQTLTGPVWSLPAEANPLCLETSLEQ